MCIHPQELEDNRIAAIENELWWQLDKIAVANSEKNPSSTKVKRWAKADAATNMMAYLVRPTHEWCQERYRKERENI